MGNNRFLDACMLAALLSAAPLTLHAQSYEKDTAQPIDISSDTLDVEQTKQIAVFRGNVVAIQGDMRLRSDVMTVHYNKKENAAAEGESAPAANAGANNPAGGQNAISKIVVHGNVVLATPEESAQGNDGVYEVDKKMLHMTGNVVLTRGQNILRGTQLDYNLVTGRSVLIGSAGNLPNTTGGRVRGVFIPESDKTKK